MNMENVKRPVLQEDCAFAGWALEPSSVARLQGSTLRDGMWSLALNSPKNLECQNCKRELTLPVSKYDDELKTASGVEIGQHRSRYFPVRLVLDSNLAILSAPYVNLKDAVYHNFYLDLEQGLKMSRVFHKLYNFHSPEFFLLITNTRPTFPLFQTQVTWLWSGNGSRATICDLVFTRHSLSPLEYTPTTPLESPNAKVPIWRARRTVAGNLLFV